MDNQDNKDMNVFDLVRMPHVIGCRKMYTVTKYGRDATRIPEGLLVYGQTRNVTMEHTVPRSRIVRPRLWYTVNRVTLGHRVEIACEAVMWDEYEDLFWLHRPCETCDQDFMSETGRVREEQMNSTLPRNQLGRLVSTKLVVDAVDSSDLKSVFYCKLEQLGFNAVVVEVHLINRLCVSYSYQ